MVNASIRSPLPGSNLSLLNTVVRYRPVYQSWARDFFATRQRFSVVWDIQNSVPDRCIATSLALTHGLIYLYKNGYRYLFVFYLKQELNRF